MRRQDRTRLTRAAVLALWALAAAAQAQAQDAPRLTGADEPMGDVPAPPVADWIINDVRVGRNYPEQPPVIPHGIEGYQLSVTANRCLECHRREYSGLVAAPMISITHFQDREGQMLADVSPRRYFCTACHVPQSNARPLVENRFRDMLTLMPVGEE
ncbi:nitrate reductase cytochrome c-type subunit [Rhodobacter sp. CZR27]|uniref:nitrate reductase cytochrome c-type subunit n=1 Tax=Rhodobacter sp. CZR27 TaxID=2033869 RepID=UPI000BBF16F4|nr:nitrate reductase cytochrome c-type subunit [Rhodobacter sp. CZR27]